MTATDRLPLDALANLAHFHREHEKFYAAAPLRDADEVMRASQALKALADRWQVVDAEAPDGGSALPYTGCTDLNDATAIETMGLLFMEGGGEPAELARLKHDLLTRSDGYEQSGAWLVAAMEASWASAGALLPVAPLADLLGDRHRIIANNWLAADLSRLIAVLLRRAVDVLQAVELTPEALRADLRGARTAPGYLYSAAALLDRAVDLMVTSTTFTRDSERAWRAWSARVQDVRSGPADGAAGTSTDGGGRPGDVDDGSGERRRRGPTPAPPPQRTA